MKKYKNVLESEQYFLNFAKAKGIKITGSFNPEKIHFSAKHFYDGMHLSEIGLEKLFKLK